MIVIVPPEGRAHASITIRESAPLRSLSGSPVVALAQLIGDDTAARITTGEGELAALIEGERGTRAVIWGDIEQTEITGVAETEAARRAVSIVTRELVYHLPLGLGSDRTRRFWYQPPPGWQGRARGLVTDWVSPNGDAWLKALPARSVRRGREAVAIEQFLHDDPFGDFVLVPPVEQTALTIGQLRGVRAVATGHARGEPRTYVTVALEDARSIYAVRLGCDGASASYESVIDVLLASIEPLRQARDPVVSRALVDAMAHWAG